MKERLSTESSDATIKDSRAIADEITELAIRMMTIADVLRSEVKGKGTKTDD